jgi:SAM-dependent methyltransferase
MALKEHQDAFGRSLMDCLERKEDSYEIIERDDGFIALSAATTQYFSEPLQWGKLDQTALATACGRILDVGCGAGRFALALQGNGLEVVAIDVSPLAIEVCRRRGVGDARVLSITQIHKDLGQFDSIVMMGHNFGLFGSSQRMHSILKRLTRVTTPEGRIIASGMDPYQTDEPLHLAYHARNRDRGRMSGQIRMRVRYKTYRTPWFDYLFVSGDELEELVSGTGWRLAQVVTAEGPSYLAILEQIRRHG